MSTELFGLDTDRNAAVRIMNQWAKTEWTEIEKQLFRSKWFDYRFLNPVQATYLYAHDYVKAYRHAFRINMDYARADFVRPLDVERLFLEPAAPERYADEDEKKWQKRLTDHTRKVKAHKLRTRGIWKGRMVADAMGMPYAIYLERAFHWALRYWQQPNLPRPQQLYSEMIVEKATIDWEERQRADFFYSTLPQYSNLSYETAAAALPDGTFLFSQDAHHEWLIDQCLNKDRTNGHHLLAQMVFHDRVLPFEKARKALDDNGFERFMSFAESNPAIERYN